MKLNVSVACARSNLPQSKTGQFVASNTRHPVNACGAHSIVIADDWRSAVRHHAQREMTLSRLEIDRDQL